MQEEVLVEQVLVLFDAVHPPQQPRVALLAPLVFGVVRGEAVHGEETAQPPEPRDAKEQAAPESEDALVVLLVLLVMLLLVLMLVVLLLVLVPPVWCFARSSFPPVASSKKKEDVCACK